MGIHHRLASALIALFILSMATAGAADATAPEPVVRPVCTVRTAEITATIAWMPTVEIHHGMDYHIQIAVQNTGSKNIQFTGPHAGTVVIHDDHGTALPVTMVIAPTDIGFTDTMVLEVKVFQETAPVFPWHLRFANGDAYCTVTADLPAP